MSDNNKNQKLAANEGIKTRSNFLRGTIKESLADNTTGSMAEDDQQVTKFHGFYQQDDRDLRSERKAQKLEPLYSFMLRARVPGGVATPEQWLAVDKVADELTEYNSIRLTTRQTFQYHGILKPNVKPLMQALNTVELDSIAACGDVNRNVMCNPNPIASHIHQEVYQWSVKISEHLLPETRAFCDIWLDGEEYKSGVQKHTKEGHEPIYGPTYLPRKFKTAVAVPPHNDVDVYTNDMGFIAIIENDQLVGFNVTAGGGMGSTHGDHETYPRLASDLGFIKSEDTLKIAEGILVVQRNEGNRVDRKNARLKYTIDRMGVEAFRAAVEEYAGIKFEPAKPVTFTQQGDRYGWVEGVDGNHHLTLFIENGRIIDTDTHQFKTGLRLIAEKMLTIGQGDLRMTANQNLIIANIPTEHKSEIEGLAQAHGLMPRISKVRENTMACVALPTCALAMAEAERYMPTLVSKVDDIMAKYGLSDQEIVMRMTGCPNGCARPFAAEVGFVGKGPGKYNYYLGADGVGTRLNKLYMENVDEQTILTSLDSLLARYAKERNADEGFGDFVVRAGVLSATENRPVRGQNFHDGINVGQA
ncbi:assimilatory sulfite reductase (NADPH) hemoprotein subunit [Flocculibacter collagenilyticus]|uniref:assimilatory sulfite reductase (NADPH) hemoprotein subunit n=1 Tax=Flocculibacter collagenilyticus TaxID=2744479 RepID=UPI0018F554CF|nr:assimilatory sulfite reductase (NADPH) hemoprotein subunit [Flocculibacter collagenilyticus]